MSLITNNTAVVIQTSRNSSEAAHDRLTFMMREKKTIDTVHLKTTRSKNIII